MRTGLRGCPPTQDQRISDEFLNSNILWVLEGAIASGKLFAADGGCAGCPRLVGNFAQPGTFSHGMFCGSFAWDFRNARHPRPGFPVVWVGMSELLASLAYLVNGFCSLWRADPPLEVRRLLGGCLVWVAILTALLAALFWHWRATTKRVSKSTTLFETQSHLHCCANYFAVKSYGDLDNCR